jgi:large repetitive protein
VGKEKGSETELERNMVVAGAMPKRMKQTAMGMAPVFLAVLSCLSASAQTAPPNGVEATSATLGRPHGVAYDAAGNLYIADTDQNIIRKVTPAGIITTVAGDGEQGYAGDGGLATAAILDSPAGVAVDSNSNIYIADTHNNVIREVSASTGIISTIAGTGVAGFSGDGSVATAAALSYPNAVAVDSNGNVYIADTNNHRIREIVAGAINTVAGDGDQVYLGDGGAAIATGLDSPDGVAVDSSFNIYIGDTHNQRVRLVTHSTGVITTLAGTGAKGFTADGPAASAALARPRGVTVDGSGNVYLADSDNNRIRAIRGGNITTIAGSGDEGFSGDGSAASTSASLDTPGAVAVSGTSILFSDTENDVVRLLDGGIINTAAGQSSNAESLVISGPASSVIGAPSTLTATFTNGGNVASGLVTFYDGEGAIRVDIGSSPLSGNTASVSTSALAVGTHTIVASYAGDANAPAISSGVFVFLVTPGPAQTLQITVPATATAGTAFNFTLTAYDQFGNVATGYTGTVVFRSTDIAATLPGAATLTSGTGTFSAKLVTPGTQTITARDAGNSLTFSSSGIVVSAPNLVVNTASDDPGVATNCTAQSTPETNSVDSACSLRDALLNAASAGAGNITFASTVFAATNTTAVNTITLSNGTLVLPANTGVIGATSGSGATLTNLVTVSGGGASSNFSVFTVDSGVTAAAIVNLNITNGHTARSGGGILNSGALTVTDSTISGNSANNGGGIASLAGTVKVNNSTLSGNAANTGRGGGIYINSGTFTVTISTISGGGATTGGGINVNSGTLTVTSSTISGNSASTGGGIVNQTATVTIGNSIVSGNSESSGSDVNGSYSDSGGNLVSISPIDLAPLGNYGGPTQAMIPLPGSPAICGGTLANAAGLTADQRGYPNTNATYPGYSNSAPCVDSGAVQTNYSMQLTTQPSNVAINTAMSPAPGVTLEESGTPFMVAATPLPTVTVPLTLTGNGILANGSAAINDATGIATYSSLSINAAGTGDALTANLILNSASSPAAELSVTSNNFNVIAITLSPAALPGAIVGTAYSQLLTATGGTSSYSYTVSNGNLPPGLTLNSNSGLLSGIPTGGGFFNFTVQAEDSNSDTGSEVYSLNVAAPTITLVPTTLPSGTYGASYNQAISASGGTSPYIYQVVPGSGSLPGGLSLSSNGTLIGTPTAPGPFGFIVQATDHSTGTGPYTATQAYSVNINTATASVLLGSLAQTYSGLPEAATATTTPAGLTVAFTYTGTSGTTYATSSTAPAAAGSYTVVATISDPNYTGTATGTLVIAKATPSVTWATPAAITYGTALSATQLDASSPVAGSFAYNPLAGTILAAGSHILAVTFTPTDKTDYSTATASVQLTVNQVSQTISFSSGTLAYASGVTFGVAPLTLSATSTSGLSVTFRLISGPATLNGDLLTINGAGTVVITASQAGNSDYTAAPQVTGSIPVSQALPAVSLASSANPVLVQNSVTLTANLTSGTGAPTGTVTFLDGTTPIGSGVLTGGVATLATSSLAVRTHSITAVYGGDQNFLPVTSSALTELVEDFSFNISAPAETALPDGSAVFTFTVSPIGAATFPANVTLSVSGLPAGATYTLSHATLTAGESATQVTLTIYLPQAQASSSATHPAIRLATNTRATARRNLAGRLAPFSLALILLPFARRMRCAGRRMGRMLSVLLLLFAGMAAVAGVSGCGSSSGFFGQQQKSYTITVTATAGALSHSATVTLSAE